LLGLPEIRSIIDGECHHTSNPAQDLNLFGAVGNPGTAGDPQRAQPPLRRRQGNPNDRAAFEAHCRHQLLQARKPFILFPVFNEERFLTVVNVLARPFFDGQIGYRQWALAPYMPFDFLGVLLEHHYVEVIEGKEFA
jgi:hypothetical protein